MTSESAVDVGGGHITVPVPRDPRCPLEPPPQFAEWRDATGLQRVLWRGRPTWLISRYDDIRAALIDPRLSADIFSDSTRTRTADDTAPVVFARIDDPEHNRLRRMMTRDFTYRRAESMRPQIQQLVDDFLDRMIDAGPPADLVRDFALPVPSLVISLLLGVPHSDHEEFQLYSTRGLDSRSTAEEKAAAGTAMFEYMRRLAAQKQREPGDDLMSRLVVDHVATGELNPETAVMNGVILLLAGHETTASMIALGTVALLQNPAQLDRLRDSTDPKTDALIVEELIRYLTIVHSQVDRVAVEDLVINGQPIRAGEQVLMNLPAGNWDPAFVDDPHVLDGDRNPKGHLGFGYGVHQCIGQNLARVELQIALGTLVRRLPGLRLAVPPQDLRFAGEQEIYTIHELPVRW
ncbi:cytochrome [Mycobacterium sp. 852013-51886_SCH5428379]|uniref:cytochrome P450 n=1 Tax=Mycobacterium sp. 852013-51886_SCH5428379 TaxID=1834111 RepID=UPI0007FD9F98|nr:cytochrome P450 [Mycobacterium sp. 852013-51886_SCH5428379]OBB60435.1 cytochrome [Mycobacterium sp. 852013-51886_SCH5428379]